MVYVNTINYVIAKDNEDFSEVVAISPFPGVFGQVEVYSINNHYAIDQPTVTIEIPIELPFRIGKSTITLNKLLVTDVYVSSPDNSAKIISFYNKEQESLNEYQLSLAFYGNGEAHGIYLFTNTIYAVIMTTQYPTEVFINIYGLYYLGREVLIYK